jgi:hypothetical protein
MFDRPHEARRRYRIARRTILGGVSAIAFGLAGCANPTFIGVQDYGSIYGNVLDSNNKPIGGALVTATGTNNTIRSGPDGSFTLPQVAVGTQTLTVSAPGYGQPANPISVLVVKNQAVSAGNIVLPILAPGTT